MGSRKKISAIRAPFTFSTCLYWTSLVPDKSFKRLKRCGSHIDSKKFYNIVSKFERDVMQWQKGGAHAHFEFKAKPWFRLVRLAESFLLLFSISVIFRNSWDFSDSWVKFKMNIVLKIRKSWLRNNHEWASKACEEFVLSWFGIYWFWLWWNSQYSVF